MIHINQVPLTDPEKVKLRALIEHEGFAVLRKVLRSQAAEKQAESANALIKAERTFDGAPDSDAIEANDKAIQAKVIIAAEKMLEQMQPKDYKFYTIELKPEPLTS